MSGFRFLVGELRRRSIWRVLAVYLAGSWIAFEVVSGLTEAVGLPEWFPAFAIGLLVLGLPVVIATALVQEGPGGAAPGPPPAAGVPAAADAGSAAQADRPATEPEERASRIAQTLPPGPTRAAGTQPSRDASASSPETAGLRRVFTWRNATIGGVAAIALWAVLATGWIALGGSAPGAADDTPAAEASIAALPLVNLGDGADAWFADGIHEEILTQLHKIGALRVISRTSVMGYRETDKNLRQIADELDVRYVLEGSVQRFGERVKVTAQLIDAETDAHLWAENYERPRADLFAIQTDVATQIAAALRAELSPEERERLKARPTDDPEAHDLYLQGLAQMAGASVASEEQRGAAYRLAVDLFGRATERDPGFAEAWARLGWAHVELVWFGHDRSDARRRMAADAVARALALDPDLGEAHLAQAYVHYHGYRDYERALDAVERAAARLRDHPDVLETRAYILRRQGRYDNAIATLERALSLDPRNPGVLANLTNSYVAARRWADAERGLATLGSIEPGAVFPFWRRAAAVLARTGDAEEARAALAGWPGGLEPAVLTGQRIQIALADRDFDGALALVDRFPELSVGQSELIPRALLRARVQDLAGRDAARESYRQALDALHAVEADFAADDPRLPAARALALAGLGQRGEALEAAAEARRRLPVSIDSWAGAALVEREAEVLAMFGMVDDAVARLEWLLAMGGSNSLTPALLRVEPRWDPLRGDARFEALVAGGGPTDPAPPPPFAG